jgi:hypothetical protein
VGCISTIRQRAACGDTFGPVALAAIIFVDLGLYRLLVVKTYRRGPVLGI